MNLWEDLAPLWLPRDLGYGRALPLHVRVLGAGGRTSPQVGSLTTLDAAVHYIHMCVYWVQLLRLPFVCRHVDWSNAVPLQMNTLILKAAQKPVD